MLRYYVKICDQHEAVLVAHFEMLDLLRTQASPDGDAFRTVNTMAERTQKLMSQFRVLKKQLVPLLALSYLPEKNLL